VIPTTVGERIRRARLDRGMTPREFARAVDRSKSTVQDWEADRCPPRASSWKRIRAVLGPIAGALPGDYGDQIRAVRSRMGLTRAGFGRLVGLSEKSIENLERQRNAPSPVTILKVSHSIPEVFGS